MIDLLRSRRSIRRFTKKPIDAESIELIEEALLRSFSSRNLQPWQFIFVDDGELLKKLAVAKEHSAEFLSGAALAVVIAGDEETSDVWIEDCSIAAAIAHLTAHSLGLGSCWIQIRNRRHNESMTAEDFIRNILDIPARFRIEAIVAIGNPAVRLKAAPKELLNFSKISWNSHGNRRR